MDIKPGFSQSYSNSLKRILATTPASKARSFMYKYGYNSSSLHLPEYFGLSNLGKKELKKIVWSNKNSLKRTLPLTLYAPKGEMAWRRFSLLHPYSYWHLVNTITQPRNFMQIKKRLLTKTLINSYSIPTFTKKKPLLQGESIETWLKFAEVDLINDSPGFSFLVVTDIRDLYESIYTHSISWALHGKQVTKNNVGNYKLLGNKLDKLFQNSRGGQTNGIPTGNMASDIIAELILCDIDKKLGEKLANMLGRKRFIASRHRDDYRFLCESETDGKYIIREFNRVLREEYDLIINSEKTKIYDDIIANFERPWIRRIKNSQTFSQINNGQIINNKLLEDIVLDIYKIQKDYAKSNAAISVLAELYNSIVDHPEKVEIRIDNDFYKIIAILRRIMFAKEDAIPYVVLMLDCLFANLSKTEVRKAILDIQKDIENYPDKEYLLTWLYRLSIHYISNETNKIFRKFQDLPLIGMALSPAHKCMCYFDKNVIDDIDKHDSKILVDVTLLDREVLNNLKGQKIKPIKLFRY